MIDTERLVANYQRLVWGTDTDEIPWWRALAVKAARLVHVLVRDMLDGQLNLRAMSLVFTTLLSIVPLLAVSFSVLKAFGMHNQLEPLLLNFLTPLGAQGRAISDQIIGFVDNIKVGVLGALGIAFLFYTTITLVQKVEEAFNYIWHIERARTFTQQFSSYLSVIMVVPVLVIAALGVTASLTSSTIVQAIVAIEPFGSVFEFSGRLVPYLLIIAAFVFIYIFIPNTRVRPGAAITGGVVAGVLWQTTGWIFALFIANSASYAAIYSGFAILVVLMIWIYWNWLILLVGASIVFYQQHAEYLVAGRKESRLSNRTQEELALMVMALVGLRWYQQRPGWSADELVEHLHIPFPAIRETLNVLEQGGLLARTVDTPSVWQPARPLETTPIKEVLDVVRNASEGDLSPRGAPDVRATRELVADVEHAIAQTLHGRTLKDLVMASELPVRGDASQPAERAADERLRIRADSNP
ncbi:MAG: YhjD/YihY/BrkB family envelope integrity protein [Gammaproteobacteria bacterium]